jgi:hypothetical protein
MQRVYPDGVDDLIRRQMRGWFFSGACAVLADVTDLATPTVSAHKVLEFLKSYASEVEAATVPAYDRT